MSSKDFDLISGTKNQDLLCWQSINSPNPKIVTAKAKKALSSSIALEIISLH
jgi:hypothetical protein